MGRARLLSEVIVGPAPPELTGGVSRAVPAAVTNSASRRWAARSWAARHWASRLVATGECRARASRATSQIGRGGPVGAPPLTLPRNQECDREHCLM